MLSLYCLPHYSRLIEALATLPGVTALSRENQYRMVGAAIFCKTSKSSVLLVTFSMEAFCKSLSLDGRDAGFSAATIDLDGSVGNFTLDAKTGQGLPLLVHAYLPEDAALRYMWSEADLNGTQKFLRGIPADTNFLFISYGCKHPIPA